MFLLDRLVGLARTYIWWLALHRVTAQKRTRLRHQPAGPEVEQLDVTPIPLARVTVRVTVINTSIELHQHSY